MYVYVRMVLGDPWRDMASPVLWPPCLRCKLPAHICVLSLHILGHCMAGALLAAARPRMPTCFPPPTHPGENLGAVGVSRLGPPTPHSDPASEQQQQKEMGGFGREVFVERRGVCCFKLDCSCPMRNLCHAVCVCVCHPLCVPQRSEILASLYLGGRVGRAGLFPEDMSEENQRSWWL